MKPTAPTRDAAACEPTSDEIAQVRAARLARVRRELSRHDLGACVLFDPTHIRYACGSRNMQVYSARNPARYLFVPVSGPVVLFEYAGCDHMAAGLETVDEVRPATAISYFFSADGLERVVGRWADEIDALCREHGVGARIGLESATAGAAFALKARGYQVCDAQAPLEHARAIKVPGELKMIRSSLRAVEEGVRRMEAAIAPGKSENEIWAELHRHVIATDGDYVETRLLSSGERTNPWFQECSSRVLEAGDLVALDTDVVGRHGCYADFSRTFLCGDGRATAAQTELYRLAYEQVQTNLDILRPGMSFREYTEKAWPIPEPYRARRYFALAHGVGMTGEYPYIVHREDLDEKGYDGIIAPGMTLCVESFIGHEDGGEGVKLEEQVYVGKDSDELLSDYPFDDRLL